MHRFVGLEAIIQPVQPPAAPATHQALASRNLALICAAFTGSWDDTSSWHWLALSAAFLAIGAAMIAVLTAAQSRARCGRIRQQLASQA
jgi:hypothetical protein